MLILRARRSVLLVLLTVLSAPSGFADSETVTVVFAGILESDWAPSATRQVEECLISSLREAHGVDTVFRSDGISNRQPAEKARELGGDLVLYGYLEKSGNRIVLRLILERTVDGQIIDDPVLTYNSRIELLGDCAGVAERAARMGLAALAPPSKRRERRSSSRVRLKIGQEGVSPGPSVPGGAYLYYDTLAEFGGLVGFSARYALATFPLDFDSHLVGAAATVNIRLAETLYTGFGPAYLLSTDYRSKPTHFVGVRVAPFHSGDLDDVSIELFPFSVFFDLSRGEFLFTLELLSVGAWLSM